MFRILAITAAAGAALCATAASATIINLASVDPVTAGVPTPTTLILDPGTYTASLITTANGGQYDAWNAASSSGLFYPGGSVAAPGFYTEEYTVSVGGAPSTDVYGSTKYLTAADAFAADAATSYQFTVASPGTAVSFQIPDTFYSDNTGGVSLNISAAVPEPATYAMMMLGVGAVGGTMRRRKTVSRLSYAA